MQGHNDVLGFKAFICHDGILDTKNAYFGTEELYFAVSFYCPSAVRDRHHADMPRNQEHDMGGAPWEVPQTYEKWSPANHIRNWKVRFLD